MRSNQLGYALVVGLVGCTATPLPDATADAPLTETEVLDAVSRYDSAWSRLDTAAVGRMLADGYVYFSSRGDVRRRGYILEDLLGNPSYRMEARRSEMTVEVFGGTAIVGSRWQGTGTYEGVEVRDDQRCSLVLVRHADELSIVAEHCTQIQDEAGS